MKSLLTTTLLLLAAVNFCFAQTNGTLTADSPAPKAGAENSYTYRPHPGIAVPEGISASIVYINKNYFNKVVPMVKDGDSYKFSFKAPDSTLTLMMCVVDDKKKIFDNNNEHAFALPLYDNKGVQYASAGTMAANIVGGYGGYIFKLKLPKGYVVHLYEAEFKKYPKLKEDNYANYLYQLYALNKDSSKPIIAAWAKQQLAQKTKEPDLLNAYYLYGRIGKTEEQKQAEQKILAAYPKGSLAQSLFYNKLYSDKEPSPEKYLAAMGEYTTKFNDNTTATKDNFYRMIVSYYGDKKDWDNLDKYAALVTDKIQVAGIYNNLAWNLSGQELDNAGTNLPYAASISSKSLQAISDKMNDPKITADEKKNWQQTYDTYADTYALILYKLGKTDSAFYYQDAIDKSTMDAAGMERYAAYAEKAKGAAFARTYIEEKLLAGTNSGGMQKQLKGIYKQLNLPEDEYNTIKEKANTLARQKTLDKIKETLGSLQAKDFSLKDLDGNTVTLASLRDKVVVLDFWATWCGPCRASFPAMQEAVTRYKDDKDVVFLFMDVSEQGDEATVKKNTGKFIADNHYTFHVLLDIDNKVSPDYKVEFIPDKFVIDRQGNIIFMGNELSDIDGMITQAKG